jgi:hypothetical protein
MAYNVAGNLRPVRPGAAYLDARDQVRRNALVERQVANAEQAEQFDQKNALFQQERVRKADEAAAKQAQQAAEQNEMKRAYAQAQRLVSAPVGMKRRLAEAMFDDEDRQELASRGIDIATLDENGLHELAQSLEAQFGSALGIAPAAPPEKYETVQGPRGSRLKRNTVTGEEIQVVGPEASGGDGPRAPSAYMFTPEGGLVPIPGGPADPNRPKGPASRRDAASLRKEFEGMAPVKDYRTVLPLFERASKAPNTRAGDISIIYALGKMFDPTSVVREGELILAKDSAPWLRKMVSNANSQISGKGALSPETRKEIMDSLKGQVEALRQSYEQERSRFASYAQDYELDPFTVVGGDANDAFGGGDVPTATGPNGQKLYLRNGKWVPQ